MKTGPVFAETGQVDPKYSSQLAKMIADAKAKNVPSANIDRVLSQMVRFMLWSSHYIFYRSSFCIYMCMYGCVCVCVCVCVRVCVYVHATVLLASLPVPEVSKNRILPVTWIGQWTQNTVVTIKMSVCDFSYCVRIICQHDCVCVCVCVCVSVCLCVWEGERDCQTILHEPIQNTRQHY